MRQVFHFKNTEERLAFLKGDLKEIVPKKAKVKEKETPKKTKKTTKAKKSTKKGDKE